MSTQTFGQIRALRLIRQRDVLKKELEDVQAKLSSELESQPQPRRGTAGIRDVSIGQRLLIFDLASNELLRFEICDIVPPFSVEVKHPGAQTFVAAPFDLDELGMVPQEDGQWSRWVPFLDNPNSIRFAIIWLDQREKLLANLAREYLARQYGLRVDPVEGGGTVLVELGELTDPRDPGNDLL